jgi:hypothetical protein
MSAEAAFIPLANNRSRSTGTSPFCKKLPEDTFAEMICNAPERKIRNED